MKKFALLCILSLIFAGQATSQEDDFYSIEGTEKSKNEKKERKLDRWSIGGNFYLSFGRITNVMVSPVFLYQATPRLLVGPGFTYDFYKDNYLYYYQSSSYGPKAIASFTVLQNIQEKINFNVGNIIAYSEYEYLNIDTYSVNSGGFLIHDGREWINNILLGGGIFQPIGERGGGISLMVLFDVTQNVYSPYKNPIFRFGFYF